MRLRKKRKTPEQISFNMKQVKCKDSLIEILLRKELWKRGYRFRKNVTKIYGKPDIVFPKERIVIFCDSEFWHGYKWGEKKHEIKSRKEFWILKIERTMERDKEVTRYLRREGWKVIRFWGQTIIKNTVKCVNTIEKHILKRRDNL